MVGRARDINLKSSQIHWSVQLKEIILQFNIRFERSREKSLILMRGYHLKQIFFKSFMITPSSKYHLN